MLFFFAFLLQICNIVVEMAYVFEIFGLLGIALVTLLVFRIYFFMVVGFLEGSLC
jgi:hypothetical protein